ncbi:MAG TPA: hypothetical protein PK393_11725, partial [Synergistaceae bacterium]|nr:hypothetical protein [Synergistaceae bacterium]
DGVPTLLPRGEDLGVEGGTLNLERSFLRQRRYTPWNAFFNGRMAERQVLCKGSVLCFTIPDLVDPAALQRTLEGGVGCHREEGLGQILVNPPWVLSPPPLRKGAALPSEEGPSKAPRSELTGYLRRKADRIALSQDAYTTGLAWAKEWFELSKKITADGAKVPGKSQWSSLREVALRFQETPEVLKRKVSEFCGESLRRRAWEAAGTQRRSLKVAVEESLKAAMKDTREGQRGFPGLALYHAAVEMGRLLARPTEEKRKGGSRR